MHLFHYVAMLAAIMVFPAAAVLEQQPNTDPDRSKVIDSSKPETARDPPGSGPETARDDRTNEPETARDEPAKGPQTAADQPPASGVHRLAGAVRSNTPPSKNR